ncbi:MAG: TRAP transporter fused permease subunit [Chloroflexota bacterium]
MPSDSLRLVSETEAPIAGKYRRPTRGWRVVSISFPLIAILLSLTQIFGLRPPGWTLYPSSYLYLLLAFLLPVAFLWIPINPKVSRRTIPWYDVILGAVGTAIPLYFVTQQRNIATLGWDQGSPILPFIGCVIMWALLIEASRRAAGNTMAIILLVFSAYPFLSPYLPGFLWSPGYSFNHVASSHIFGEDSVLGIIFRIFGSLIMGYMLFGAVIQVLGAGSFFNNLCMSFLGKTRASNAKVAVFASALFGTVSGSPISNIMTVGSFTIPAMKKEGFPPHFAAAVEACSSAGGVLMPPVMGAVAFIMAEYLQVSYADVCIAAAIPAILYYMTLYAQIDCYAARFGFKPPEVKIKAPPISSILLDNIHIIIGFVVLIIILFVWRITDQAPWIAAVTMLIISMFRKVTRYGFTMYVKLIEDAGRILAELLCVLAPIGLIVGSLVLTGAAYTLPDALVTLAGGNALLILIFGAIAAFVLGMGVTSAACYIFLAIVIGPAMATTRMDIMAVHMFILYWSILSNITPPVAIAAFAAASVAQANPMRTGYTAMMLGVAKYILPFVFVYQPALILHGSIGDILVTVITATIGLLIISGALEGYFWWLGSITIISRIILVTLGMLLVVPNITLSTIGAIVFVVVFILLHQLRKKQNMLARLFLRSGSSVMFARSQ